MRVKVRKGSKLTFIIFLIMFIVMFGQHFGWLNSDSQSENVSSSIQNTSVQKLHGPYKVVRVVDGDTIIVDIDGVKTRVRMIGVNTPESVHPDESKNSQEGIDASEFTKEYLNNKEVYIEYDVDKYDDYGRTLAYIYLDKQGEIMYQQLLLDEGIAEKMVIEPNTKYFSK